MFDLLRCHPSIDIASTADTFLALGGSGRRYPVHLSDTKDSTKAIEAVPGGGSVIPDFPPPPSHDISLAKPSLALEKLHPMVFGFDAEGFARRVESLSDRFPDGVQIVYLVREPAATLRSFISYQRRAPGWSANIPQSGVVDMYLRSYETMDALIELMPGQIVAYEDMSQALTTLSAVYESLTPEFGREAIIEIASHALVATQRDRRAGSQAGPFLGDAKRDGPTDMELQLGTYADDPARARQAFDRCRQLYRSIAAQSQDGSSRRAN